MTTLLRFLRMAVAAALVAAASGVPQAVQALVAAADCCGEPCESERDGRDCPPGCPSGSCGKVFPSAVPHDRVDATLRVVSTAPDAVAPRAPVLPLVASGVFHPPRA